MTHETFIHAVRDIALTRIQDTALRAQLASVKLVYGVGASGLRGICYFSAWKNGQAEALPFVEVCARGEESPIQLAGTTIHEIGHALAGPGAGHKKEWKAACERLGLNARMAGGQDYQLDDFAADVRHAIAALTTPIDGAPVFASGLPFAGLPMPTKAKACPMGVGTRGGTSRGVASGSRLRKWACGCEKPVIARVASDDFRATCDHCSTAFKRAGARRAQEGHVLVAMAA